MKLDIATVLAATKDNPSTKLESSFAVPPGPVGLPEAHALGNAILQAVSQQVNMASSGNHLIESLSVSVVR